jgi:hypothetical protein
MRMRFRRRQPLFGTAKSTELSPPAADKPLDFEVVRRMTPAATMRPISANRASGVMRSGGMELGPETGSNMVPAMATFRDVNDGHKLQQNHKNTSISIS